MSFHDGVAFYPLLGPDAPRNLPLRWQTTSIRRGDQSLVADGERHQATWHDEWRFEYRYGALTEAYDLLCVDRYGVEAREMLRQGKYEPEMLLRLGAGDEASTRRFVLFFEQHLEARQSSVYA